VNFFAKSCVPCVQEMPAIQKVASSLAGKVAFVGIDTAEPAADGEALARQTGVTYLLGHDPTGDLFADFHALGLPTTVFVSPSGTIKALHVGALTEGSLRDQIRSSLGVSV
jgi:thiol-disulfide isomerase/thioredoxin